MKFYTFHSNLSDISIDTVKIEKITETQKGNVKSLITQTNPVNRNISIDNAFVLYTQINTPISILGIICVEPNDVRTKYAIQGEDIEKRNYHEFTYILIEERLFNEETLIHHILRQIISLCVCTEPIDEVFWLSDSELYSQIITKVFKTCNEYYFQNEANYFTSKLISINNEHGNRAKYIEEIIKKNAPE